MNSQSHNGLSDAKIEVTYLTEISPASSVRTLAKARRLEKAASMIKEAFDSVLKKEEFINGETASFRVNPSLDSPRVYWADPEFLPLLQELKALGYHPSLSGYWLLISLEE